MPNGGGDCCRNCAYNVAAQKLGRYPESSFFKKKKKQKKDWGELSECSLRKVSIHYFYSTFCANFRRVGEEVIEVPVKGPIYAQGYTEEQWTYPRIPWHGDNEVFLISREVIGDKGAVCNVCDRELENGLLVLARKKVGLVFCCNAHYIHWRQETHPGEELAYSYHELRDPDDV